MKQYLRSFQQTFPGLHSVWASIVGLLGIFSFIYTIASQRGSLIHTWVSTIDAHVMTTLLSQRGNTRSDVFLFFTYLGNWEIILTLSIVVIVIMLLFRKVRATFFFIATLIIGQLVSLLFKYMLQRNRPDTEIALIIQNGYSFPSGHALGAFVFYGMIGYFAYTLSSKRWQKILAAGSAMVIIGLIGISRLYLGVHWLSDVIGGWLMGATLLIVFFTFFEHRERLLPTTPQPPHFSRRTIIITASICIAAEILFIWWFYISHPLKGIDIAPFPQLSSLNLLNLQG